MLVRILPFMALILFGLSSPQAMAINKHECSIWLCMPFGFPSGCADAKKAFKHRIKHFKPPLPRLDKCLLKKDHSSSSLPTEKTPNMGSKEGIAAFIPTHRECLRYASTHEGNKHRETRCVEYATIPAHAVKDVTCRASSKRHDTTPKYCTQTIRYVDFLLDGQPYQDTYYYDSSGNQITVSK